MSRNFIATFVAATALAVGIPAYADVLSTTGSVSISFGSINFYPLGGSTGDFQVGPPDTGIFSGLVGSNGTIKDLNNVMEPVGATVNVPNFMTLAAAPNLSFTITELLPGTFSGCPGPPPVAGQTCTVPGTPYNLTNQTAMSSIASFTIDGYITDTNNPGVQTPFVGIFSTQFVNESYQQVVAQIESGQSVDATYSAQFITTPTSTTPEPGTMVSLLSGGVLLLGIGSLGKRFRSSKQV